MIASRSAAAPLALTMGEPAGIGGELALKAWLARGDDLPPFALIDDPKRLVSLARRLDMPVPIRPIASFGDAAAIFDVALPVLPIEVPCDVIDGSPNTESAPAVLRSIELAAALAMAGTASAVVTNPIQKSSLYEAGFSHPGHTEYLADLAGTSKAPVMMLACRELRVVPLTVHLPLADVPGAIDMATVVHKVSVTEAALRIDFAVAAPVIAVAGLNPHAGEDGTIGREEQEIIIPAIEKLRRQGLRVNGPFPADSLFHPSAREGYDAAICMYHDQALIPIKTIDFSGGINLTLGLPFVRTSPDHGTALDIAGSGKADPTSLIAAMRLARVTATNRAAGGQPSAEAIG